MSFPDATPAQMFASRTGDSPTDERFKNRDLMVTAVRAVRAVGRKHIDTAEPAALELRARTDQFKGTLPPTAP